MEIDEFVIFNSSPKRVRKVTPDITTSPTTPKKQLRKFKIVTSTTSKEPTPPPPHAQHRPHAPHTRMGATEVMGAEIPKGSGLGCVVAYLRRSSEDRTGRPLVAQIETIKQYVQDTLAYSLARTRKSSETFEDAIDRIANVECVREYFMDNGISGTTPPENRPGLSGALKLLISLRSCGNPAHLVVYDATRLARSVAVGSIIKEKFLEQQGINLHLAQSRLLVEGRNADSIFNLGLQMASYERTSTITRLKSTFKYKKDWDPRKSFGWRFNGAGVTPTVVESEQVILGKLKAMYEEPGAKSATEIAKQIQSETGPRERRDGGEGTVDWTGTDVKFLARKHSWVWGGENTIEDLRRDVSNCIRSGGNSEEFLKDNAGKKYNGAKLGKAAIRNYFPELQPEWKRQSLELVRVWIKQEKYSIDDISEMLQKAVNRPGGWPRQSTWRVVQIAGEVNDMLN